MNRFREDTPYVFRPPKYSAGWAKLIYMLNDAVFLRGRHRIADIQISGEGAEILECHKRGDSLLITPNHSDHSDPHIFLHLSGRFKVPIHFMAAREIFELNYGINGAVLQRAGVFSIDREGSDLRAIKEAMRIVFEAKYPLVIFPEGEIYHLNSQLTPLNEGAATIMLRAAKRIKKEKNGKGAFIFPTALKFSYTDDVSKTFGEAMDRLEDYLHWKPQRRLDIVQRIYKFGEAILSLKEKELLDRTLEGELQDRLHEFREILIGAAEEKYFGKKSEGHHAERVRRLRGKIRTILLADERPGAEVRQECFDTLDRLYFALQLYSYPGQYLKDNPTADKIAETILKFEEDVFNKGELKGRRKVEVNFCPPINMFDYLDDPKGTTAITLRIEDCIRKVLEN